MSINPLEPVVRGLRHLLGLDPAGQSADAELLERYAQGEDEAAFARLSEGNRAADESEDTLRLSIDAKAALKIGLFSRGERTWAEVAALDHVFKADAKLVPFGILLPRDDELPLYFARPALTSDFIADVLEAWWLRVRCRFPAGGRSTSSACWTASPRR